MCTKVVPRSQCVDVDPITDNTRSAKLMRLSSFSHCATMANCAVYLYDEAGDNSSPKKKKTERMWKLSPRERVFLYTVLYLEKVINDIFRVRAGRVIIISLKISRQFSSLSDLSLSPLKSHRSVYFSHFFCHNHISCSLFIVFFENPFGNDFIRLYTR